MAKGAYIGVNGLARKIKKGYVGVDGVARKIKKAYIGIGGVARPCWGSGEPVYYGTAPTGMTLYSNDYWSLGIDIGNYALFCTEGGGDYSNATSYAVAYNSSLVKTTASGLSPRRSGVNVAKTGNYAVFAGSYSSSGSKYVNAYNTSLTRSTPTDLAYKKGDSAAASIGNYALFAGGYNETSPYVPQVDAYNTSLTRSNPTNMSYGRGDCIGGTVGNYALIAGGQNGSYCSYVETYNTSLTKGTATSLSAPAQWYCCKKAVNAGDYLLFAGGYSNSSTSYTRVNAYNSSLTRTIATATTSKNWQGPASITLGGNAFIGFGDSDTPTNVIEKYDPSLTKTSFTMGGNRANFQQYVIATATVGSYALFAGGKDKGLAGSPLSSVDVIAV